MTYYRAGRHYRQWSVTGETGDNRAARFRSPFDVYRIGRNLSAANTDKSPGGGCSGYKSAGFPGQQAVHCLYSFSLTSPLPLVPVESQLRSVTVGRRRENARPTKSTVNDDCRDSDRRIVAPGSSFVLSDGRRHPGRR